MAAGALDTLVNVIDRVVVVPTPWSAKSTGVPRTPAASLPLTANRFGLAEQRTVLESDARPTPVEGSLDVLAVAGLRREVAPISACGTALSHWRAENFGPYLESEVS